MIVAIGNEDKLYEAKLAHILQLFRQAHPEMQLCELPAHGKRQNQMVKDGFTDYSHVCLLLISDSFRPLPMITRASF